VDLLGGEQIEAVLAEEGIKYRQTIYAPIIVVWAFLSQVLSADKSCQNIVSRIVSWCAGAGERIPSVDTGGYTKARQKLPETVMKGLLDRSGDELETKVLESELWCGRHIKILDGTTVTIADTEANQAEYPQHGNQATGCGLPLTKLVAMFSLLTGAVIAVMVKPWRCSEAEILPNYLIRSLLERCTIRLPLRAFGRA
jgi:Insertion element 4 transposase N-terminal